MLAPRVLLITDAAFSDEVTLRAIEAAGRALPRCAFAVQLREKERPDRAAWAAKLRDVTRTLSVAFVVNGDVALARDIGADGVHFGRGTSAALMAMGEGLWRSMAAHDDEDVERASRAGVDAVLVSPVFASPGKGVPCGVSAVTRATAMVGGRLSVLALGGVDERNARSCFEAGADGVAVIRALLSASDPASVALALAGPAAT